MDRALGAEELQRAGTLLVMTSRPLLVPMVASGFAILFYTMRELAVQAGGVDTMLWGRT